MVEHVFTQTEEDDEDDDDDDLAFSLGRGLCPVRTSVFDRRSFPYLCPNYDWSTRDQFVGNREVRHQGAHHPLTIAAGEG